MENIDNSFASILVFYENFKRSKLIPTDLDKIAKKYRTKPNQLIVDLEKKYHLPIPTQVCSLTVVRICAQYGVPPAYVALLPANIQSAVSTYDYDATLDVRSDTFDAEKVIQLQLFMVPTIPLPYLMIFILPQLTPPSPPFIRCCKYVE